MGTRTDLRAAALVALLTMAGCGLPGDERIFSTGDVTVVDGASLVTDVREGAPDPGTAQRPVLVSPGSLTELAVHWMAPTCVEAWHITIPNGNALRVVIQPAEPPSSGCGPETDARAITLELNRVVQADAIDVEQLEDSR